MKKVLRVGIGTLCLIVLLPLCASAAQAGASAALRKGKLSIADMANAALAGGVAVGATCNTISAPGAFGIGLLAGAVCVLGYTVVQPRFQSALKIVDTCGVHNLHGMPGLVGGLAAIVVIPGTAKSQLAGIVFTVLFAFVAGSIGGALIRMTGSTAVAYSDSDEISG